MNAIQLGRALPVIVGTAAGVSVVSTSPYTEASLWPMWALLAITLSGTAGAVFGYGMSQWKQLPVSDPPLKRRVVVKTAGLVLVALTSLAVVAVVSGGWRGPALTGIAILGAGPAGATMFGVEQAARLRSPTATPGELVARLLELRRIAQGLLVALGSLVALSTFALAAAVQVHGQTNTIAPADELADQLQILVFGLSGSALVGVLFVGTAGTLRRRGREICQELFDVSKADDAAGILSTVDGRHKLEQLLGIDRGLTAELQTGLIVLGPLLASLFSVFLPS